MFCAALNQLGFAVGAAQRHKGQSFKIIEHARAGAILAVLESAWLP